MIARLVLAAAFAIALAPVALLVLAEVCGWILD